MLTNLSVFSQTLILTEKGDTAICFSVNKGKYILGEHYKLQECQALLSVCETQKMLLDSVITNKQLNIDGCKQVIYNQSVLLSNGQIQIKTLENEIKIEQKNTRKQIVYKWLTTGCGVAVTVLMGYLLLAK